MSTFACRTTVAGLALLVLVVAASTQAADQEQEPTSLLNLSPVEQSFEPVGQLNPKLSWLLEKKVRGIWIGGNLDDPYPQENKSVGQVLADAGFNLVCVAMGPNADDPTVSSDLTDRLPRNVREAKRVGITLLVGWQYGNNHHGSYRRYRSPQGAVADKSCCPRDTVYIRRHVSHWAQSAAAGGADGFVLNTQMYGSDEPTYPGPCVCDICFATYLKQFATGKWRDTFEAVPATGRGLWLEQHEALGHYAEFLAKCIETQYDATRRRCQNINAAFMFGHAPALGHLPGIERGLGTSSVPCLVFSENEYQHGPVPDTYQNVQQITDHNIPAFYLPGLWILKQAPQTIARHAMTGTLHCQGWWAWYGDALFTNVSADDQAAFTDPHGRYQGTSADDYIKQITATHQKLDGMMAEPENQRTRPTQLARPRQIEVRPLTGRIKIDGRINDAAWQNATLFNMAMSRFGRRVEPTNTMWMCWDKKALYFAIRCPVPEGTELVLDQPDEDDLYLGPADGVELFVSTRPVGSRYAHLAVSPLGDVLDSMMAPKAIGGVIGAREMTIVDDPNWTSGAKVATTRERSAYVLEMRIPFKSLGASPRAGDTWSANFCRRRPAEQTWSPTFGGYHSPSRFGILLFVGK